MEFLDYLDKGQQGGISQHFLKEHPPAYTQHAIALSFYHWAYNILALVFDKRDMMDIFSASCALCSFFNYEGFRCPLRPAHLADTDTDTDLCNTCCIEYSLFREMWFTSSTKDEKIVATIALIRRILSVLEAQYTGPPAVSEAENSPIPSDIASCV